MMRDHGHRSPESSRRRRRDRQHSSELLADDHNTTGMASASHSYTQPQPQPTTTARARAGSSSTSDSGSSTSDSLLNISAAKPRSGFLSFFRAAPESSRRRRSRKRKRRFLRFGNSSSSSVDDSLAYGRGYISRTRVTDSLSRDAPPSAAHLPHRDAADPNRPGAPKRAQTDEEILEIGRQLAEMARNENMTDLAHAGRHRPSQLVATASAISKLRRQGTNELDRGLGGSKPHRGDSSGDDSGWESASDDDSFSDDAVAGLAYGSSVALPSRRATAPVISSKRPPEDIRPPNRKSSAVDPKMFGPVNSLRGYVNTPCGFDGRPQAPRPGDPHYVEPIPPIESASIESRPLQTVYPVPTSDPTRFDAGRGSIVSGAQSVARPDPVPIQAPKPMVPVSKRVFDDERYMDNDPHDSRHRSDRGGASYAGAAAVAGVAGVAIGAAMLAERKDKSKDKDRDERRVRDERYERDDKRHEKDDKRDRDGHHRPKRNSVKIIDERDDKRSRDDKYDDRSEKRRSRAELELEYEREKQKKLELEYEREKEKRRRERAAAEYAAHRRGSPDSKEERIVQRKEAEKDDRRDSKSSKKYSTIRSEPVDPFQFQVSNDAFETPSITPGPTPKRPLTPMYVTVEREPDFSRIDAMSFDEPEKEERRSRRDSFEQEMRDGKRIYEETKHSTAPIAAAAIAAGVAAVAIDDHEREHKRGRDPEPRSRDGDSPKGKDRVQEEADRYYRETVIARKIAEEQIRSRSASPDPSVLEKYKEEEEEAPLVRIVTPPEMEHKPEKSPYEGPDADVRIDNKIYPDDLVKFRVLGHRRPSQPTMVPIFVGRDPSCERERPLLNLVYPTPLPSPSPEKMTEKEVKKEVKKEAKKEPVRDKSEERKKTTPDVVIGPKGEIIRTAPTEKPKTKLGKKSKWGMVIGAIGAGAAASAVKSTPNSEPAKEVQEPKQDRAKTKESERVGSPIERDIEAHLPRKYSVSKRSKAGVEERDEGKPPQPGPKPSSPRSSQMPGAFADDLDFAATVAAGLQDTGFDPNIVIEDATFRRRDSPPGSNESAPYQRPFAETVTDLGIDESSKGKQTRQSSTDKDAQSDDFDVPSKLNKKERRKLEKAAKRGDAKDIDIVPEEPEAEQTTARQVDDFEDVKLSKKEQKKRDKTAKAQEVMMSSRELPRSEPVVAAVEDEWAQSSSKKKKGKKSKKSGSDWDDEPTPSRDKGLRRNETAETNDDDWTGGAPVKPKEAVSEVKSRSWDDEVADEAARRGVVSPPSEPVEAAEDEWESSKKKSKKSKKESRRVSVPVDAFDDIKREPQPDPDEWQETSKKSKKSKRDSAAGSEPYSETSSRKSKKDRRKSAPVDDGDEYAEHDKGEPPDRKIDKYAPDERDVSSVVSGPTKYNDRYENGSNGSHVDDGDDTKSTRSAASAPAKGGFFGMFKANGDKGESKPGKSDEGKKNSFLDNAGTLGAGVGLAGAAVAVAAHISRQNAVQAPSDEEPLASDDDLARSQRKSPPQIDLVDPEIVERVIKPAIDPQYGDLLPLPPSEPGSPSPEWEELPPLPDSRPATPPEDRTLLREKLTAKRRSANETPVKSPSHTAVPIQFRLGQRSVPSSPGFFKPSPLQSPVTPATETASVPRRLARPTSWDSSREIKPLYLLEHSRSNSSDVELQLPELPPSEPPSTRDSPTPKTPTTPSRPRRVSSVDSPLRIDTAIANSPEAFGRLGSQETTPKAEQPPALWRERSGTHTSRGTEASDVFEDAASQMHPSAPQSPVETPLTAGDGAGLPPLLLRESETLVGDEQRPLSESQPDSAVAEAASQLEPPAERDPSPVEAMTKDRSSYLLHATPPSTKKIVSDDASPTSPSLSPSLRGVPSEKSIPEESDVAVHAALGIAAGGLIAAVALHEAKSQDPGSILEPEHLASEAQFEEATGSKRKKDKKGRKNQRKSQAWADDDDDAGPENRGDPAEPPAPEISQKSEAVVDVFQFEVRDPELPPAERSTSTSSKKGNKKKGKKFTAWEAEEPVQDIAAPATSIDDELPKAEVSGKELLDETKEDVPTASSEPDRVDALAESSADQPLESLTEDPAKSSDGPAHITEQADVPERATPTGEFDEASSTVKVQPPKDDEAEASKVVVDEPSANPPVEAASTSGNKGNGLQVWEPEESTSLPEVTQDDVAHLLVADQEPAKEEPEHGDIAEAAKLPPTSELEDVDEADRTLGQPTEAFAPTGKKGKKKKKGKKVQAWETDDEPGSTPLPSEEGAMVEDGEASKLSKDPQAEKSFEPSPDLRPASPDDKQQPTGGEPPVVDDDRVPSPILATLDALSAERGAPEQSGAGAELGTQPPVISDKSVDDTPADRAVTAPLVPDQQNPVQVPAGPEPRSPGQEHVVQHEDSGATPTEQRDLLAQEQVPEQGDVQLSSTAPEVDMAVAEEPVAVVDWEEGSSTGKKKKGKKEKKDKKGNKKRQDTQVDEPLSSTAVDQPPEDDKADLRDIDAIAAVEEAVEPVSSDIPGPASSADLPKDASPEDLWSEPAGKKGKKGKKKKASPLNFLPEDEPPAALVEEPVEVGAAADSAPAFVAKDRDEDVPINEEKPEPEPVEPVVSLKKSKKDKKGKKSGKLSRTASQTDDSPSDTVEATGTMEGEAENAPSEMAEQAASVPAEPDEDLWEVPTTKAKKGKKKRQTTGLEESSIQPPAAQTQDIADKPVEERARPASPLPELTAGSMLSVVPEESEELVAAVPQHEGPRDVHQDIPTSRATSPSDSPLGNATPSVTAGDTVHDSLPSVPRSPSPPADAVASPSDLASHEALDPLLPAGENPPQLSESLAVVEPQAEDPEPPRTEDHAEASEAPPASLQLHEEGELATESATEYPIKLRKSKDKKKRKSKSRDNWEEDDTSPSGSKDLDAATATDTEQPSVEEAAQTPLTAEPEQLVEKDETVNEEPLETSFLRRSGKKDKKKKRKSVTFAEDIAEDAEPSKPPTQDEDAKESASLLEKLGDDAVTAEPQQMIAEEITVPESSIGLEKPEAELEPQQVAVPADAVGQRDVEARIADDSVSVAEPPHVDAQPEPPVQEAAQVDEFAEFESFEDSEKKKGKKRGSVTFAEPETLPEPPAAEPSVEHSAPVDTLPQESSSPKISTLEPIALAKDLPAIADETATHNLAQAEEQPEAVKTEDPTSPPEELAISAVPTPLDHSVHEIQGLPVAVIPDTTIRDHPSQSAEMPTAEPTTETVAAEATQPEALSDAIPVQEPERIEALRVEEVEEPSSFVIKSGKDKKKKNKRVSKALDADDSPSQSVETLVAPESKSVEATEQPTADVTDMDQLADEDGAVADAASTSFSTKKSKKDKRKAKQMAKLALEPEQVEDTLLEQHDNGAAMPVSNPADEARQDETQLSPKLESTASAPESTPVVLELSEPPSEETKAITEASLPDTDLPRSSDETKDSQLRPEDVISTTPGATEQEADIEPTSQPKEDQPLEQVAVDVEPTSFEVLQDVAVEGETPLEPQQPEEDFFPVTRKLSAKEKRQAKKAKKSSSAAQDEPAEAKQELAEQSRSLEEEQPVSIAEAGVPQIPEPADVDTLAADEIKASDVADFSEFPITRKLSKKEAKKEKKRKGAKQSDSEGASGTATPRPETQDTTISGEGLAAAAAVAAVAATALVVGHSTEATEEDFPEFSTKKSKKDKKRKGSKRSDSEPASGTLTPATEEPSTSKTITDAPSFVTEPMALGMEQDTPVGEAPAESQEGDAAAYSVKTSKKDKKGKTKRNSSTTADATRVASPIPEHPEEAEVAAQGAQDVSESTHKDVVPSSSDSQSKDVVAPAAHRDLWDDEDFFEPNKASGSATPPTEVPLGKLEINPAVTSMLNTSQQMASDGIASPPTAGWGLMTRHDSDVFEKEGHVPKLFTLQSYSPTFELSPEEHRQHLDEALRSPASPPRTTRSIEESPLPAKPPGVDLTPAQESRTLSHEPPFADPPTPGKKIKTEDGRAIPVSEFPSSVHDVETPAVEGKFAEASVVDPLDEEPDSSSHTHEPTHHDIAASYLEHEDPEVHHVSFIIPEPARQADSDLDEPVFKDIQYTASKPDDGPSARDIAASYLEETGHARHASDDSRDASRSPTRPDRGHERIAETQEDRSARNIAADFIDKETSGTARMGDAYPPPVTPGASTPEGIPARDIAATYLAHKSAETEAVLPKARSNDNASDDDGLRDAEMAAAAGALTGGVALLAQKFGGSKKGKKGKGKGKVVDKRSPRDSDMFDDAALWEGADRKPLDGSRMDADSADFWDAPDQEREMAEPTVKASSSRSPDRDPGSVSRGLDLAGEKAPQPSTTLPPDTSDDDMDLAFDDDSPILGRSNSDRLRAAQKTAVLQGTSKKQTRKSEGKRRDESLPSPPASREASSEPSERHKKSSSRAVEFDPEDDVDMDERRKRSAKPSSKSRGHEVSDFGDFRRSLTGVLAPVMEEGHEDDHDSKHKSHAEQSRHRTRTPEGNRDSGFVTDSPRSQRRSLHGDEGLRDSGVHFRDGPDDSPRVRETRHFSPEPSRTHRSSHEGEYKTPTHRSIAKSSEREMRPSPLGEDISRSITKSSTPVLREPAEHVRTPEPQKADRGDKKASYKGLGVAAGAGAVLAGAAVIAAQRSVSDNSKEHRSSPRPEHPQQTRRSASNTSITRLRTPEPLNLRPESPGSLRSFSGTPPLRRVDKRVSGDLRSLSQRSDVDGTHPTTHTAPAAKESADPQLSHTAAAAKAPPTTTASANASANDTPVANEGRVRARDMTDVYDGFGEGRMGSPSSPTRPHSMRRRQSMQVLELKSRVDQLAAENRMLNEARTQTEHALTQKTASVLAERDEVIDTLKRSLQHLQNEVSRLTEVNEGLNSAITSTAMQQAGAARHLDQLQADGARGLQSASLQDLQDKDAEIAQLRAELEQTQEQMRELQRQILASKNTNASFLTLHDVDYFDTRCQQLCSHVQQWVLRFSKFSDMRACRLTSEINDEKIIDRLDNAVLDGSDVDRYLRDRVRRRDVFMSMTMYMIWEFVFTRYLFGMDREQRQKLKALEKLLGDVGPPKAVRHWRAVTLTLLSRRAAFAEQRDRDTEAVVQAVLQTLSMILPPPSNLEDQIQAQLRRVLADAVDLAVAMRCQPAEYMMLPPQQPEYDANGDLADQALFDAGLMHERSGDKAGSAAGAATTADEQLEAQGAVVRIVLFPLVVRKGDDDGNGDDEVVVCPAQVLVARPAAAASSRRSVRGVTPSSEVGGPLSQLGSSPQGVAAAAQSNVSMADVGGAPAEAEYLEGGI